MAERQLKARITAEDRATPVLKKMRGALVTLGAAAAAFGAVEIGRRLLSSAARTTSEIVRLGSSFEKTMSTVRALLQPTTREFEQLSESAKLMGRTTVFSAGQAADAQEKFALAGLKTKEIVGALPATLNLAAAGELGMGEAAEIAATALKTFGIATEDLQGVVDSLVFTASNSNQSVRDMAEAFKFVAPAAAAVGVSITEINATLAFLADRGLKASLGGTALRKTLTTLAGSAEDGGKGLGGLNVKLRDTEGRMLPLADIVDNLRGAGVKATDAYELFGERAGNAMALLLKEGGGRLREFTALLEASGGTAERVGSEKLDNLQGDVTLLTSAWEGFSIALFEQVSPALREIVQDLTKLINETTGSEESMESLRDTIADVAIVLADFGLVINPIITSITRLSIQATKLGSSLIDGIPNNVLDNLREGEELINELNRASGLAADALGRIKERAQGIKLKIEIDPESEANFRRLLALAGVGGTLDLLLNPVVDGPPAIPEPPPLEVPIAPLVIDPSLFSDIGGLLPEFGADLEFNIDTLQLEKSNSLMRETISLLKETGEAGIKRNAIEAAVVQSVATQVRLGEDLLAAWASINQDFGDSPELLAAMGNQILLAADGVREGLNPELDLLVERLLLAKEAMEGFEPQLISMGEAIRLWSADATAFSEEMAKGEIEVESLGDSIKGALLDEGVNAALSMGDALVDAAFGAKIAWGDFLKGLIADMTKAILRMLILNAIAKAIGGAFGGPAGAAGLSSAASAGSGALATGVFAVEQPDLGGGGVALGADLLAAPIGSGLEPAVPITVNLFADGAMFLDEGMPTRVVRQVQGAIRGDQQRGTVR